MKDVGCWDVEDGICLSYGYDQKRLLLVWTQVILIQNPSIITFETFILLELKFDIKNMVEWNF